MNVVILDCNYTPECPHSVFVMLRDRLQQAGVALTVDNAWSDDYAAADLVISADPLRDRSILGDTRLLGQRTLNRYQRMEIAARNGGHAAAFGSPDNDDALSALARDWGDTCVLKYDWSSRRNGVFLWPLDGRRQPFPGDFQPGCDLFMAFLAGDPLTYKLDAFCGTVLGSWVFPTRSMRQADWQIVDAAAPTSFEPPPNVIAAIRSASEALVSYGVGYASYDLMRADDGFKLIEINSCSVSTEMWNYWPDRYAQSYADAILQTLRRLDTVPRFSQLRRLAQRAGNDPASVALPTRPRAAASAPVRAEPSGRATQPPMSVELAFFNDLAKTERLPPPALIQFWQGALAALIHHARQTVPFYRDRLAPLLSNDGTVDWTRWFSLPVIRIDDLRDRRHAMLSRAVPALYGSVSPCRVIDPAGMPAMVAKTSLQLGAESCIRARLHLWHGIERDATMATLLPTDARLPGEEASWVPKWLPGPHGAHLTGDIDAPAATQLRWLNHSGATILRTTPGVLRRLLAAVAAEPELRPRLRWIVTQGEAVSDDDRARCRALLARDIIDALDLAEAGIVAIQCPATGVYHIQSEVCLVEVLDADGRPCGPDAIGEIVVTPLYSHAMPLMRYATGRFVQLMSGRPDPATVCACGRGLPSFRRVAGNASRHSG